MQYVIFCSISDEHAAVSASPSQNTRGAKRKLSELQQSDVPSPNYRHVKVPSCTDTPSKAAKVHDPDVGDTPGKSTIKAELSPTLSKQRLDAIYDEIISPPLIQPKGFYGSSTKRYLSPMERKELQISPTPSNVTETDDERKHSSVKKNPKNKSLTSTKKAKTPLVKNNANNSHNSAIKKQTVTQNSSPDLQSEEAAPGNDENSPRKCSPKKFFKHRQISPSKRKRAKQGVSVSLHKGFKVNVKVQSNSKNASSKEAERPILLKKTTVVTGSPNTREKVVVHIDSCCEVNEGSQDLFPDYSQNAPVSTADSGCDLEPSLGDSSQGNKSPQGSAVTDAWSNCSTASDSVALLSDVSSESHPIQKPRVNTKSKSKVMLKIFLNIITSLIKM